MKRIENFFRFDCRKFCNDLREKGLQQKEICEKISISESTLSNWISGKRTPRATKYPILKDVAEEYGLNFKSYLVKDDSPDKSKKALLIR